MQHRTIFVIAMLILLVPFIYAAPSGPIIYSIRNETITPSSAALVNTSGGSITTMVLNATTQNLRWKAYVGNVSGTLTLDDANSNTIFDWTMANVVGEVYATRAATSISWASINCSTVENITNEELAINHTSNPDDNISATFAEQNHASFYVGNVLIPSDDCFSLHTYQNDSAQTTDFEEILLHDSTNMVYATILENDELGYDPNQTFDFQMIVPERGIPGWSSSTAYYFYVELI